MGKGPIAFPSMGAGKCELVSYTGTGKYDTGNETRINLPFTPKLIGWVGLTRGNEFRAFEKFIFIPYEAVLSGQIKEIQCPDSMGSYNAYIDESTEKTFIVRSSQKAEYQMNTEGYVYYVLLIG